MRHHLSWISWAAILAAILLVNNVFKSMALPFCCNVLD